MAEQKCQPLHFPLEEEEESAAVLSFYSIGDVTPQQYAADSAGVDI